MLLVAAGMSLTACADKNVFGTLTGADGKGGGACSAFPRPQYAIRGKTSYDQKWADETTEGGVAGCSWKRPAPRPAALDAKAAPAAAAAPGAVPAKPAKRNFWHWFRHKPAADVQGG